MAWSKLVFLKFIGSIGIATENDVKLLQCQIDKMNYRFQLQIDELKAHHDGIATRFANHKKKTEEELGQIVEDVTQIIDALDLLQKTAHAERQLSEIRRMVVALRKKRTRAQNALLSVHSARSENQIDAALADAANE
jgi:hypothetical protein